ncbi:MAG: phosphatase PAP2 family protein [Rhodobacterales bacterium 17-64-5]|nr:MAG: phosphatase PAP2 family protein [Rhodobacterales bacterium 17-64-5]
MDAVLTGWINGLAGQPVWDAVMRTAAAWGVPLMVALVAVQWWGPTPRRPLRHVAIVAGLAFVLGLALNQGALLVVHRLRPYEMGVTRLLIAKSADWSFPSDHATAAFAIVASFWIREARLRALAFGALAALIGFARVYLGIHYAGDILGGAVTGILAAALVARVYREGSRIDRFATGIL